MDIQHRTTRNLGLAAYVKLRGLQIVSIHAERENKTRFTFSDPDEQFDSFEIDYANSEARRHDDEVRLLKQMSSGGGGRRSRA